MKLTIPQARKLLTRTVDPECSLHHDVNESGPDKIKMRAKKTGKLYAFPALSAAAQEWRNDPANLKLLRASHTAPHEHKAKELLSTNLDQGLVWQNYALASCNPCRGFSASQYVPGTPLTGGASSGGLSYWLGMTVNNGTSQYLMQPVCMTGSGSSVWTLVDIVFDYVSGPIYNDTGIAISPGQVCYPAIWWDGTYWNVIFYGSGITGIQFSGMPANGAQSPVLVKETHSGYASCTDVVPYSSGITNCLFASLVVKNGSGVDIAGSVFWQALGSGSCGESTYIANANTLRQINLQG